VFETPTVAGFAQYLEAMRWVSVESTSAVFALEADRTQVEV
jgi:hypothetical protein